MSAERFYGAQKMTKTSMQTKTGANKPKRRLKAEIATNVEALLGFSLASMKNMVVKDLETLEAFLEGEV